MDEKLYLQNSKIQAITLSQPEICHAKGVVGARLGVDWLAAKIGVRFVCGVIVSCAGIQRASH